jgi:hypothetical protein
MDGGDNNKWLNKYNARIINYNGRIENGKWTSDRINVSVEN